VVLSHGTGVRIPVPVPSFADSGEGSSSATASSRHRQAKDVHRSSYRIQGSEGGTGSHFRCLAATCQTRYRRLHPYGEASTVVRRCCDRIRRRASRRHLKSGSGVAFARRHLRSSCPDSSDDGNTTGAVASFDRRALCASRADWCRWPVRSARRYREVNRAGGGVLEQQVRRRRATPSRAPGSAPAG
jgi:hypothetical protein